jgi:hypothetical protein
VNSAYTTDLRDDGLTAQNLATGPWRESNERPYTLSRMVRVAGFVLSLTISAFTAIPDPWLAERKRRDAVVSASIYQEAIGRFVSRREALRIARQILDQAERERLAIAEFEAARGVQWGDEP